MLQPVKLAANQNMGVSACLRIIGKYASDSARPAKSREPENQVPKHFTIFCFAKNLKKT